MFDHKKEHLKDSLLQASEALAVERLKADTHITHPYKPAHEQNRSNYTSHK